MTPVGLYVHIPFCAKKCPYCDFYSCGGNREVQHRYIDRVLEEMANTPQVPADSLYLGGGTPSLLLPQELSRIVSFANEHFALQGEITLEANPGTVQEESLAALYKAGFNRISFGVQSFVPEELRHLGRLHTAEQAATAVLAAHRAGFSDISVDLMLGIPDQTLDGLRRSLEAVQALPITHLSAYLLKIEENTPFACEEILARLPDEEQTCALYEETVRACERMGLKQYEISNFAKPGFESKHNLKYWKRAPYLSFGPSAHGFFEGVRTRHSADLNAYLTGNFGVETEEAAPDALEETIALGLRLTDGLDVEGLIAQYHLDASAIHAFLAQCQRAGWMKPSKNGYAFTTQGFLLSNTLLAEWLLRVEKM